MARVGDQFGEVRIVIRDQLMQREAIAATVLSRPQFGHRPRLPVARGLDVSGVDVDRPMRFAVAERAADGRALEARPTRPQKLLDHHGRGALSRTVRAVDQIDPRRETRQLKTVFVCDPQYATNPDTIEVYDSLRHDV